MIIKMMLFAFKTNVVKTLKNRAAHDKRAAECEQRVWGVPITLSFLSQEENVYTDLILILLIIRFY